MSMELFKRVVDRQDKDGDDLSHLVQPGKGTQDFDLLTVMVHREDDEAISMKVSIFDPVHDAEFILGEFTTWTGKDFVSSELVQLEAFFEVRVITTGVTTGAIYSTVITRIEV